MSPIAMGLLTFLLLFCWWLARQARRVRLERLEREAQAFWSRLPLERKQIFLAMRGLLQERIHCDERLAETLFRSHLSGAGRAAAGSVEVELLREDAIEALIGVAALDPAWVPCMKLAYKS